MIKKDDWFLKKDLKFGDIILGVSYHSGKAILGPIFVFLGLGLVLDKTLHTKPIFMLIGLVIAFFTTNFLLIIKSLELDKANERLEVEKAEKK